MWMVKALRDVAATLSAREFATRFGPAALVQSPPEPVFREVALRLASARTVMMAHRTRLPSRLMTLLQGFDALVVHFLEPNSDGGPLSVGRLSSCRLAVFDPSVSKVHASLRWDESRERWILKDEGSLNGTYVNAMPLENEERPLTDGETVNFGDASFMYLRNETLYQHLLSRGS